MVAHLVKLKLALQLNSFRTSPWRIVGLVLGLLYGLAILLLGLAGLVGLRLFSDGTYTAPALVLIGSLVVLGWAIIPVFLFGVDETLDPLRFQTFSIPRRQFIIGLTVAALLSVPAIMTALLAIGTAFAWSYSPGPVLVALLGAVIAVFTCVVLSRATTTAAAEVAGSRRVRDVTAVVAIVLLVGLGPLLNVLTGGLSLSRESLTRLAGIMGWTPLGFAWSAPAEAAAGSYGLAAIKLLLALVVLALATWAWQFFLTRSMERGPTNRSSSSRAAPGLGWFSRFPATPVGAVAARTATYWSRDPRYFGSLAVEVLMPLLALFIALTSARGDSGPGWFVFLFLAPFIAYLTGWGAHADVSYDNTAFALHVSSGITGRVDRVGRIVPWAVIGTAFTVIYAVGGVWVAGRWDLLALILGFSLGLLLAGLGLSSVVSIAAYYPTPAPGANPFQSPPGATGITMLVQSVTGLALLVLMLPGIVLGVLALVLGSPAGLLGWLCALVSLGLGVAYLVIGVRRGARIYDRRAPDVLTRLRANS